MFDETCTYSGIIGEGVEDLVCSFLVGEHGESFDVVEFVVGVLGGGCGFLVRFGEEGKALASACCYFSSSLIGQVVPDTWTIMIYDGIGTGFISIIGGNSGSHESNYNVLLGF